MRALRRDRRAASDRSCRTSVSTFSSARLPTRARIRGLLTDGDEEGRLVRPQPDDYSVLWYTSGTTGKPKGVPWRQRALVETAQMNARRSESCARFTPAADDARVSHRRSWLRARNGVRRRLHGAAQGLRSGRNAADDPAGAHHAHFHGRRDGAGGARGAGRPVLRPVEPRERFLGGCADPRAGAQARDRADGSGLLDPVRLHRGRRAFARMPRAGVRARRQRQTTCAVSRRSVIR